jgi:subtilase family serine protease
VPRIVVRLALTAAASLVCSGMAQAASVRTDAGSGRRVLVQQATVVPAGAAVTGALAASAPVQLTLALTPSDPQALAAYAQQVSDPGSALYRQYLSVGEFAARFGAGASEVASVRAALSQAGLSVGSVSANGLSLSASGSAAQIEAAFATQLDHITLADGTTAYADVTDPTLPAAAAGAVQTVTGLDTLPAAAPADLIRARGSHAHASGRSPKAAGPSSCIASESPGAYTAAEIGAAYGMDGAWDVGDLGAGATVALAELEPYLSSDVAEYQTCDGTNAAVTNINVDGGSPSCAHGRDYDQYCGLEDVLDIEDIAGLAPDSTIDVYEAPNTNNGLLDLYQSIVDQNVPIISTSWGACETAAGSNLLAAENVIFQEAAVQGEAVFAAAGDDGANDCKTGVKAVDDPASQPYVTGVGGTTMTSDVAGAAETVWNDSGAGGGGVSRDWAQPTYQSGFAQAQSQIDCTAAPGGGGSSTSCREVPDVAADADPNTGYDVYWEGSWGSAGGTSAATPTWASLVALADSSSACIAGGVRVGFANELLYSLPASDFDDVTSGNNSDAGVTGYSAGSGYDMASGRGTPNGAALLPALCGSPTVTAAPPNTQTTTTATTATPTPTPPTPVPTTPTPIQGTPIPTTRSGAGGTAVRFLASRRRRTTRVGRRVRVLLRAHDQADLKIRFSARRLPKGLHINRTTGLISGRPTRMGRSASSITARDSHGDSQTIVIRWVVRRG